MNINDTLNQRGTRYGEFKDHADLCQRLKEQMRRSKGWPRLDADMTEALEMIQHKVARILNGDPTYHDSWHDIAGYASLVAGRLVSKKDEPEKTTRDTMQAVYLRRAIEEIDRGNPARWPDAPKGAHHGNEWNA